MSIISILGLIYLIIFSSHGYRDYKNLKLKEIQVNQEIEVIESENKRLEDEIKSLKSDPEYIKHIAKQEQDMAEDREIIFKLRNRGQNDK